MVAYETTTTPTNVDFVRGIAHWIWVSSGDDTTASTSNWPTPRDADPDPPPRRC